MRVLPLLLLLSTAALAQGVPPYPRPVRSVVAYPPDGGALVTFGQAVVPITCDHPDGGTCVLDVQGRGGGNLFVEQQGTVEVTGIAGARVGVEGPVTATISGTPSVSISGVPTVALQNGTIVGFSAYEQALLAGQRTCADYLIGNNTISSTLTTFPNYAGQQTASVTFHDFGAAVDYVACWRSSQLDGGPPPSCTPDAGVANIPMHSGSTWVVDGLADHHRLRCLACTHAGPPSGGTALAGGSISICTPSP